MKFRINRCAGVSHLQNLTGISLEDLAYKSKNPLWNKRAPVFNDEETEK